MFRDAYNRPRLPSFEDDGPSWLFSLGQPVAAGYSPGWGTVARARARGRSPSHLLTGTDGRTVLGYPVVMTESFARQAEEIAKHQAEVIANEAEITKRWAEELQRQTTDPLAKPVVHVRGRYKYTVQLLNHPFNHGGQFGRLAVENLLNEMAQRGWEFVESMPHEDGRLFVFRSLGE